MSDDVLSFGRAWDAERRAAAAAPTPMTRKPPGPVQDPDDEEWSRWGREFGRNRAKEWRCYQSTWRQPIDEIVACTGEDFYNLRRNVLLLTRAQCARLLRVGGNAVRAWEVGEHPVTFSAYLTLLLVSESNHFRLASKAWNEWSLVEHYPSDSRELQRTKRSVVALVNRKTGAHFTAEELDRVWITMQKSAAWESENQALRSQLGALTQENTELRELFRLNAITDEMHDMRDRLEALLGRINTARVVPLKKSAA